MKLTLRGHLRHFARFITDSNFRRHRMEVRRLEALPRYQPTLTTLAGGALEIVDALSFLEMYEEIWERRCYEFLPAGPRPVILDGGANVGLSVAFFKEAFPGSEVIAFEADPAIFAVLERNIRRRGYRDVTLVPKALWTAEGSVRFAPEGSDAGRLARDTDAGATTVAAVRLRDYLDRRIDLLKLDIEGAETAVLLDCADRLGNVANLFVEYHGLADEPQAFPRLVGLLADAGFRLSLNGGTSSPRPMVERRLNAGMDLQVNLFAFRTAAPPRPAP